MKQTRLYPSGALHGQVAHEIGRRIVSGGIGEGEVLPGETELSRSYQVGRQAIREALKVLAAKGLLTTRRRVGSVVAPRSDWNLLDPDVLAWHGPGGTPAEFLDELIELRFLIEPSAAELAALRGDGEHVAGIGEAVAMMAVAGHNVSAFHAADIAFHVAVFAASGNSLIERLSTIIAPLLQASFGAQSSVGLSFDKGVALHEAVYQSIARRDAAGAKSAMQQVIMVSADEIRELKRRGESRSADQLPLREVR